ncbi:MAG: hypothetical protein QXS20_02475 [Candidatus Thorarchaeota archaeon]
MSLQQIERLLAETRTRLGYARGVPPLITAVYRHHDGSLHVVTTDRAEKSLMMGPGGRVAAELSRAIGTSISVYSQEELLTRRHRLQMTRERCEELADSVSPPQRTILEWLVRVAEAEMKYPEMETTIAQCPDERVGVSVALSGGTDSTAVLAFMVEAGMRPLAITVDMGDCYLSPSLKHHLKENCDKIGVVNVMVDPGEDVSEIGPLANAGRQHPCRRCHQIVLDTVLDHVRRCGIPCVVTGETLPTGRQSVILVDEVLMVHLPAALAWSKYRTRSITRDRGLRVPGAVFGCAALRRAHSVGWRMVGPSILRVLRELDAGVLSGGEALRLIRSIIVPVARAEHIGTNRTSESNE